MKGNGHLKNNKIKKKIKFEKKIEKSINKKS